MHPRYRQPLGTTSHRSHGDGYVLLCRAVIDGTGRTPIQDAELHLLGNRIEWLGGRGAAKRPDGAMVVDLGEVTVLPGLIDCHEHLGLDVGDEEEQCAEPIEYIAARCARTAQHILRSGITTIRDVGEKDLIGPMFKRAIEEGVIPGPRMLIAGRNIVRTGGHCWFLGIEADGPDAIRAAVREEVQNGADLIKIMATGGVSTQGSDPFSAEFSMAEMEAAIDEAHTRGRKVAAHALGGAGVQMAVEAGVDSIEHGLFLTDDDVTLMSAHETYLVMTAGIYMEILRGDVPQFMKEKISDAVDSYLAVLANARGTGLRLALGTDINHGRLYREMELLVRVGYEPMEALLAATKNAADLCGVSDHLGTLEPGKLADLIAVPGDPLDDVACLANVCAVMKNGAFEFGAPLDS